MEEEKKELRKELYKILSEELINRIKGKKDLYELLSS